MTLIPIDPIAASRPRVTRNATFYSKRYTDFKAACNDYLSLTHKMPILDGAVRLRVVFDMPIPKSWSKKRKNEAEGCYHTSKPDSDNLQKALLDAMNGIVFEDDSQVADIRAVKRYAKTGGIWYKAEQILNTEQK